MWTVLGFFLNGPLSQISKDLKEAFQSKTDATTERERIAADERINLLEARKSTILAAQSDPVERWVRITIAFPFIFYINKLIIWDKVLGWGTTDALSSDLTQLFWVVIGGYFLDSSIKSVARIIKK